MVFAAIDRTAIRYFESVQPCAVAAQPLGLAVRLLSLTMMSSGDAIQSLLAPAGTQASQFTICGSRSVFAGYVARWNQIDFSNPRRPTLTCAITELHRE